MLSAKRAKWLLHILIPIFIMLFSMLVCVKKYPEIPFYKESIESLEKSQDTVTKLTAVTLGISLVIDYLPDDYGSSLSKTLTDMDKYFVLLLAAIFLERIIAVEGSALAFTYLIPVACILYICSFIFKQKPVKVIANKIAILSLAIILVIPCSTHLGNVAGERYLDYVDSTIEETQNYTSKISDKLTESDDSQTLIEKFANAVSVAINSIKDIAKDIKAAIAKFMNSIAILIITTCVVPALTFIFFLWILQQIFSFDFLKASKQLIYKDGEGKKQISEFDGE